MYAVGRRNLHFRRSRRPRVEQRRPHDLSQLPNCNISSSTLCTSRNNNNSRKYIQHAKTRKRRPARNKSVSINGCDRTTTLGKIRLSLAWHKLNTSKHMDWDLQNLERSRSEYCLRFCRFRKQRRWNIKHHMDSCCGFRSQQVHDDRHINQSRNPSLGSERNCRRSISHLSQK